MRCACGVVWAEMKKQHRNYFHSKLIYISLFVWPALNFITACFSMQVFDVGQSTVPYLTAQNLVAYLMLGYLCMSFFRCLVQSAWRFSQERFSGTLELIYLSPANRSAILLGNALASLVEGAAVMVSFGAAVLLGHSQVLAGAFLPCAAALSMACCMAVLWGVFLNALFLYSRDSDFVFTLLEEPMEIFSGVKVPVEVFPLWAKCAGALFPLTYALEGVRRAFLAGARMAQLRPFLFAGACIIILLYLLTAAALHIAERHGRRTGSFTLF